MIRTLKVMGLALLAVFAMSAVAVSAASAQKVGKLTSDGPVTLVGTQTGGEGSNALTAFGGKIECEKAFYTGHKYKVTPHELIPSGESTTTITPHFGECRAFGKFATVDMNGCDSVFHLEATTGTDKYEVKATIICPTGAHIQVTLFKDILHLERICTYTIQEKATDYTGLTATDTTNGHVDITGTLKEITIEKEGAGILCAKATTATGELDLDLTFEGRDKEGFVTNISLSD